MTAQELVANKDKIFDLAFTLIKTNQVGRWRWSDFVDYVTEYKLDENLDDCFDFKDGASMMTCAHFTANRILYKIEEHIKKGNY